MANQKARALSMSPFTIDLTPITALMSASHYILPRWQPDDIAVCELMYRRFLSLLIEYPNEKLAPSKVIDEYWHAHILHTQKYHDDCMAMAGKYIHHTPADATQPDAEALQQGFQRTLTLYESTFGEPMQVFIDTQSNSQL